MAVRERSFRLPEPTLTHRPTQDAGQAPIAWKPPSTWMISPVVAGKKSESRATTACAVGEWLVSSQPSGARSFHIDSRSSKPGIALAARVLSGPAETRLLRMPDGPRSRARYRFVDSSAALATPIQSYAGHATVASNVIPTTDEPSDM